MTTNKAMNKKINSISKAAKKHHGATIAVVAGAGLSVLGNATIGVMTIVKAVKNKKAAKAADPQPALPAPAADNNSNNPPAGDNQDNQNPAENK